MKLRLLAVSQLAALLAATVAFAAPELSVDHGSYNFGTITQGKKVQHNFTIRNSGDAPLQIKQLAASCGCTAAKPSTSLVLPGKTAEIMVTFDSANFTGKVEKTVAMTTNAGKSPSYVLKLEGNILEELQVTPRQLSVGPVTPGVAKQASITVANRGTVPVKLTGVNVTSSTLQIRPTIRKEELKAGETGTIELSVTARPDAKVLSGYLHIQTNSPRKKEITVPVYATVAK